MFISSLLRQNNPAPFQPQSVPTQHNIQTRAVSYTTKTCTRQKLKHPLFYPTQKTRQTLQEEVAYKLDPHFAPYFMQGQDSVGNVVRDMKCLKLDLDRWRAQFEEEFARKATLKDMQHDNQPWMIERYHKFMALREFVMSATVRSRIRYLDSWYIKELNSMGVEVEDGMLVEAQGWTETFLREEKRGCNQYDKYFDNVDVLGGMDIVTKSKVASGKARTIQKNRNISRAKSKGVKELTRR
eukprot:TRINITY_DN4062_c0_g1_i2.p2 TRINITY_DN4062_c0_g1~~TRINITY_DN4062_c0_g1_i2.p2  ORF type:complete len:258 (-),score=8.98 TRINITY_DN4062_c0_g1_i2:1615-2334(-)